VSQDNAGFAEFFAASWDPCLRAVAASTGNMTLAEDQTAEAFARAWASWHKVGHHPAPRAWVVRTTARALVKTGIYCSSSPAAPDPASIGVLSVRLPVNPPHVMVPAPSGPAPSELKQIAARTATVINPAAMPSGTELFFGYSTSIHALFTDLIYTSSYTCSNNP
jgi:hypothetical protein